MRILHTSDWHLGKRLYGRERKAEFRDFLTWLLDVLDCQRIDCLILAGDVFDTVAPPVWAQSEYFQFLVKMRTTCCHQAIVTAGNHDSPFLLDAPKELLECLSIHTVGVPADDPRDDLFPVAGDGGDPELFVCAEPFLRTRDLCPVLPGEEPEAQEQRACQALAQRYRTVVDEAQRRRGSRCLPIVALGHLFAAGGSLLPDHSERSLSVGSLDQVPLSVFPEEIDYLALGHLHSSQLVGGRESRRYSGSPLALSFSEAEQVKQVDIVDFDGNQAMVTPLAVPCFQKLKRLKGTFEELSEAIRTVAFQGSVWLELIYTGTGADGDLWQRFKEQIEGTQLELLRVTVQGESAEATSLENGSLDEDWTPEAVFQSLLAERHIEGQQADELIDTYHQALAACEEEGENDAHQ